MILDIEDVDQLIKNEIMMILYIETPKDELIKSVEQIEQSQINKWNIRYYKSISKLKKELKRNFNIGRIEKNSQNDFSITSKPHGAKRQRNSFS